jgi:Protein of unknown function (DUF3485)
MYRLLLCTLALGILGVNGLVSGLWHDRWTVYGESAIAAAATKLEQVPRTIGSWEGYDVVEDKKAMPEEIIGRHLLRRYVDRNRGTAVTVFLTCGGSRPMWSGHLPTECYPSAGYQVVGSPTKSSVAADASASADDFWMATFSMEETPPAIYVRVFWSWSGDGRWQTPQYPHRAFARYPFLYKLYIVRPLLRADEPSEGDPSMEFLKAFLPELKKALF